MNNDNNDLNNLCKDAATFRQQVLELQKSDPLKYDKELLIPLWNAEEGKEKFSVEVKADVAKFIVHASWLQDPAKSILSAEENINTLNDISKRIADYAQRYLAHFKNDSVCKNLIEQLNKLDTVLQNISRPSQGPKKP